MNNNPLDKILRSAIPRVMIKTNASATNKNNNWLSKEKVFINRFKYFTKEQNITLLIDGSNMFIRNCSIPSLAELINSKGQKTGGIFGTLRSILLEIGTWNPISIFFIMDKSGSNRRKKLYPEYKINRGKGFKTSVINADLTVEERMEYEARARQIEVLKELLPLLGIKFCMIPGLEADDIISYLSNIFEYSTICSCDTDFIQLQSKNTIVYNPITRKVRDVEEFGSIGPTYALLKSIIGDPSDNIKGLFRVGWKTVQKWCDKDCPQSLEELRRKVDLDDSKLSNLIKENWEMVERNFKLISLSQEVLEIAPQEKLMMNNWKDNSCMIQIKNALKMLQSEEIGQNLLTEIYTCFSHTRFK